MFGVAGPFAGGAIGTIKLAAARSATDKRSATKYSPRYRIQLGLDPIHAGDGPTPRLGSSLIGADSIAGPSASTREGPADSPPGGRRSHRSGKQAGCEVRLQLERPPALSRFAGDSRGSGKRRAASGPSR